MKPKDLDLAWPQKGNFFQRAFNKALTLSFALLGMFAITLPALAAAPILNSAKITGPNTVTVAYSVPVYSNISDYSNFSGALNGRGITAISGGGTGTIILTFNGSAFGPSDTGGLSIATTTVSTSDNSPFAGATIGVGDGQPPMLTSFVMSSNTNSPSSTLAKIGDTVTITLAVNKAISAPSITIAGHPVGVNGSGSGPYVASYTLLNGDTTGSVNFTINMTDTNGNASMPINGLLTFNPAAQTTNTTTTTSTSGLVISQVTPVPAVTTTSTPNYSFNSTASGTINYSGDCSSHTVAAIAGLNAITFNFLADGPHYNCTFNVVDGSGNVSNTIFIPAFTVQTGTATTAPATTTITTIQTPAAPATGDGFIFTKGLGLGMTNNDVLELQKRLTVEAVYRGPLTGKFGALTYAAVKLYQKNHGINQLGYVGPATRASLNNNQ